MMAPLYLGADSSHGHVQPNGAYHYHGIPTGLVAALTDGKQKMVIVGWAADGFPIYNPVGYSDPADAKAAADDRQDMLAPVIAATKAGKVVDAVRSVPDRVTGVPGTFDTLPPPVQASLLENARVLPVAFAAPPPPKVTCTQLGEIKIPVTIARGELTRTFYRIAADTASQCIPGSRLLVVPGARHAWPAQQPSAFDDALREFLAKG